MNATKKVCAKIIGKCLRAVGWRSYALAERINPTPPVQPTEQEILIARWIADNGDKELRQVYDLSSSDVVLDVGGYEGQWASDIIARYGCLVHIFEPVPAFAENIKKRFSRNSSAVIHAAGLGHADGTMEIAIDDNASSQFVVGGDRIMAPILGIAEFLSREKIGEIGLMKINIEGGEYPLMEKLLSDGSISRIRELQIQFHNFVPNADTRMANIQAKLSATHYLTYQYPFIWENWRRIEQQ